MKVVKFMSAHDREEGLRKFDAIPTKTIFWFPDVQHNPYVTTRGLCETIWLIFLDGDFNVLQENYASPEEDYLIPPRAVHLVEMSAAAKRPTNWQFLRNY